ncbi:hypothetical protein BU16DRAFT_592166 [Lophium mytilinum]|uniref:F-box domain-containing protein n=1 Tax=Lophium mytilinum TaxID=390894 RepID=A0A6A6QKH0_9PEZI|nr:hypothetical protein BU16DRAFT_592166 [Lophium mytilinum]
MPFWKLPNELIFEIAKDLDSISLSRFCRTSVRYHDLLKVDVSARAIGELSWAIKCRKFPHLRCLMLHHVTVVTPGLLDYHTLNRWPILHQIIYQRGGDYLDLIQELLEQGADVNLRCRDSDGGPEKSPLDIALAHVQPETASLLIEYGALARSDALDESWMLEVQGRSVVPRTKLIDLLIQKGAIVKFDELNHLTWRDMREGDMAELAKLVNMLLDYGAELEAYTDGKCFMDRASANLVKAIALTRTDPPHAITTCILRGVETASNKIKKTPISRQGRGSAVSLRNKNVLKNIWKTFDAVHGAYKSKEKTTRRSSKLLRAFDGDSGKGGVLRK